MIQVWYANRIERLAGRLMENLMAKGGDPRLRLFAMPPIVVPKPSFEIYLRYQLALGSGIASGLTFHVIDSFVESLLPKGQTHVRLLDRGQLRAFYLDVLSDDPEFARKPLPQLVQHYLDVAGTDTDARDLRRYQLANRLASLAQQYGDLQPDLLQGWADTQTLLEFDYLEETENWQRDLWTRLAGPHGPIARARTQHDTRWVLPIELFDRLGTEQGGRPPDEIHFFGFEHAWPGVREQLTALEQHSEIHIYALTPTVPFRRDLKSSKTQDPAASESTRRPRGRELIAEDDESKPPIVRQWGRPGHSFFSILNHLDRTRFRSGFAAPSASTVLSRLQKDLLAQEAPSENLPKPDDSLMILACSGIRREAEIIANEIWRLISEDDRQGNLLVDRLKFRDIAVALADTENLAVYQAQIRAAFEEIHSIPHAMTELPLSGECQIVEAILSLLKLPFGRFTRPEMLKVLTHPALQARFPEADTARWSAWCEALAIVHGGDHEDHVDTYIDRDLLHWEQGIKRLVLGAFMTGPKSGDPGVFEWEGAEYVPHDESTDSLADSARLFALVRSLIADSRFLRKARLSYWDWSKALSRMVATYFAADSPTEQRALSRCLEVIEDLKKRHTPERKVGYRVIYEGLREALGELTGSRGAYLAEGVVVSPLSAMSGLPFRVVFVAGLGEGRFPSSQGPDPLDVGTSPERSAVTPRERDKFDFLQTLATTQERLYLSYIARDAQTGERLEPSPLIHELIGHLDQGRSTDPAKIWIKEHPLRRYADDYFSGGRTKPTFLNVSRAARSESRAHRLRESLLAYTGKTPRLSPETLRTFDSKLVHWLGLCSLDGSTAHAQIPDRLTLTLREIRRFLECPLQGWARLMLRLREDEEDDIASREDEYFSTGRITASVLLREVFFDMLGGRLDQANPTLLESLYVPRAEAIERQGLAPLGLFRDIERRRHLDCLLGWQSSALRRGLAERGPFEVYRFGRAPENETVARLERPIILEVPAPLSSAEPKTIRVEIHGNTEILSRRWPGSLSLLLRDSVAEKDFLGGFLDAVVLSLLPDGWRPAPHHVHVIPTPDIGNPAATQRTLRPIDQAAAQQFLTDVVADLIGGAHAYLLPCEAVFSWFQGRPIASSIEQMKEDDKVACSSRFGPVPNFSRYEPPDEQEAARIIERRFGLFRESGGILP